MQGSDQSPTSDVRERYIAAALDGLQEVGAAELTLRRVADRAETSTMGIYSRFGGRNGLLEAVYRRGFELLRAALLNPDPGDEPVVSLARVYRRFALANPALYALMFERPLQDFEPSAEMRQHALETTFDILVGAMAGAEPLRDGYLMWATIHGLVSIELTHAVRTSLDGWFIDSPEAGDAILVAGVRATLRGLAA